MASFTMVNYRDPNNNNTNKNKNTINFAKPVVDITASSVNWIWLGSGKLGLGCILTENSEVGRRRQTNSLVSLFFPISDIVYKI